MEIFYAYEVLDGILRLDAEEAGHCLRVMRHRPGDAIDVIDGRGNLYHCTLLGGDSGRGDGRGESFGAEARIDSVEAGWHSHPYRLTLAVCPTKNPDRYEWMAEKATEVGLDRLVPVIGERSERKVLGKAQRLERVLLSAAKQSLKGSVPELAEPVSVKEFVAGVAAGSAGDLGNATAPQLKLIAYCSNEVQPRTSIMEELRKFWAVSPSLDLQKTPKTQEAPGSEVGLPSFSAKNASRDLPEVIVLIGPEGDFSPEEVRTAIAAGFIPVSLGESRLRTETAAVTAAEAVYLSLL